MGDITRRGGWLAWICCALLFPGALASGQTPACVAPVLHLSPDYAYFIASMPSPGDPALTAAGVCRWRVDGSVIGDAPLGEGLLLGFDGMVNDSHGTEPTQALGADFAPGRFDQALAMGPGGKLAYPTEGHFNTQEGALEMWVALRFSGDDPAYAAKSQILFHYRAPNGDYLVVSQSSTSGILYWGGQTDGAWQSAYGGLANTRTWAAGEWHHFACTWSAAGDYMRCYLDGALVADTNEDHYRPPAATGAELFVGGDVWGNTALYWLDGVRLSTVALSAAEIAARARQAAPAQPFEMWRSTEGVPPGAVVEAEYAPSPNTPAGAGCASAPLTYPGIPLTDPDPPSTLLPAGATEFALAVTSTVNTACRYAVNTPAAYEAMTAFDSGAGGAAHSTVVRGLDPDPNRVNDVYVRCAAYPDYLMHLQYRSLSEANPSFPRTGNLWGWWGLVEKGLEYCARIDLWLGADFSPGQIRTLRTLNPDIRILTSINAVENDDVPEDFFIKDIHGNKVEVWPGSYRLNLTKPEVAEYQARYAYQRILDSGLMQDGCFFDNVMTTQSWQRTDIYGNPFLVDADEDGVQDDQAAFDAAWKAGVFHEIECFRKIMPHAIVSGHSMNIYEPGISDLFNGLSIGFATADVIENKRDFEDLFDMYAAWHTRAIPPFATMVESSPPDQIAYGYDYSPLEKMPASTLAFAESYYPCVRFGLGLTLMQDGFFAHEFGDTWHGNDWWYDELDVDLGQPLGPAERVALTETPAPNRLDNNGFEQPLPGTWSLWADTAGGYTATLGQDTPGADGPGSAARIQVTATAGVAWRVNCYQSNRTLEQDTPYELLFWARADHARSIEVSAQKGGGDWRGYGLDRTVDITTDWAEYRVAFTAKETAADARIEFFIGAETGAVWLDDVVLRVAPPPVYRRAFDNGMVLLNGSKEEQTVPVHAGYKRFQGAQAARHEYILDDADAAFSWTGDWVDAVYDSGEWKAAGPFYHDWGAGCRRSTSANAEARWTLRIPEEDTYTITAWWPAAPEAGQWSPCARFEVLANGAVVAGAVLDQRTGGDEWHDVAQLLLRPEDNNQVRFLPGGPEPCIADALHVRSATRYNDGAPVTQVTLQPMDSILLVKDNGGTVEGEGETLEGDPGEGESPEGEGEDDDTTPGCCRHTTDGAKTGLLPYRADAAMSAALLCVLVLAGRRRR